MKKTEETFGCLLTENWYLPLMTSIPQTSWEKVALVLFIRLELVLEMKFIVCVKCVFGLVVAYNLFSCCVLFVDFKRGGLEMTLLWL